MAIWRSPAVHNVLMGLRATNKDFYQNARATIRSHYVNIAWGCFFGGASAAGGGGWRQHVFLLCAEGTAANRLEAADKRMKPD